MSHQNTILQQASQDWSKMREPAIQHLTQARGLLSKLRSLRGEAPPTTQEKELVALIDQLTGFCQQIEAQFVVVQQSVTDHNRISYEQNIQGLLHKLGGWHSFLKIRLIQLLDFTRQWTQVMGVPVGNKDPKVVHTLAAHPKQLAAYKAWESALLFPRKVSSIMEIGSKFGVNALVLGRMARMGAVDKDAGMITLAKKLESSGITRMQQPPVGFTQCDFQPSTISTLPADAFDAVWFHRQVWNQWIRQDGPNLVSALGELANRAHFLFFTTTEEFPPRHDLLSSRYHFELAGEYTEGTETFRFFVAQRRFLSLAGSFFPCSDMRLHDPTWQGVEHLGYGAVLLPWNKPSAPLQTRRLLIGNGLAARTFLKRTANLNAANVHIRETEVWRSIGGLTPELPTLEASAEDPIGYHLRLDLHQKEVRFPKLPMTQGDRFLILRAAIRLLSELRLRNLHLNFLRVGNFALGENTASFLSAEFISHEELEDPIDALLWFLRDIKADAIYWHDWPIEPFRSENISSLLEEHQDLGILALRSKNIDQFLQDPLVKKRFLD